MFTLHFGNATIKIVQWWSRTILRQNQKNMNITEHIKKSDEKDIN